MTDKNFGAAGLSKSGRESAGATSGAAPDRKPDEERRELPGCLAYAQPSPRAEAQESPGAIS